jgi:hypothetical protein
MWHLKRDLYFKLLANLSHDKPFVRKMKFTLRFLKRVTNMNQNEIRPPSLSVKPQKIFYRSQLVVLMMIQTTMK